MGRSNEMFRLLLLFLFLAGASSAQGDANGQAGKPTTGLGSSEAELRQRLRSVPGDFETRWRLAELLSATARPADAVRELEAAVRIAPTPLHQGRVWFRIGQERARLGRYDEALDAYERKLALGDVDAATLSKSAELLMVLGRLRDSTDRYREALEVAERREPADPASNGREGRAQIARAYLGLAVALDRDARPIASREAIGRALALDPGLAALGWADPRAGSGGDFVPPGDAFYTLGLAREGQGRATDAAAAFQDYLRATSSGYAPQARDHLARLAASSGAPSRGDHPREGPGGDRREPVATTGRDKPVVQSTRGVRPLRLRVVHQATLSADGPLVAPMIDAAWRMDPRLVHLLEECLSSAMLPDEAQSGSNDSDAARAPGLARSTLSLELRIEDTGRVSAVAVSVRSPGVLGAGISPCVEAAVRGRFRVTRPALRRPTRARMELVLAPVATDGV